MCAILLYREIFASKIACCLLKYFNSFSLRKVTIIMHMRWVTHKSSCTGEANNISQLVKVGVINLREGVIFPTGVTRDSLWMSGIPSDGTPVTRENYPNVILSAVIYTFSSCNILLAIFGTVFMMGFRNRR